MKNSSLLKISAAAFAVFLGLNSASAATIYDKDGTTLNVNGRIRVRISNGDITPYPTTNGQDASLSNNARFGLEGRTKVNDYLTAFAFTQWDTSDGNHRNSFGARDQYVGADFGKYGKITAGRYLSPVYDATVGTDIHYDFSGNLLADCARRAGQLKYQWSGYGFNTTLEYQTAQDDQNIGFESPIDIDSGFAAGIGYTFDDVVFGPLSFQFAYEYLKGQSGSDIVNGNYENVKLFGAGVTWGVYGSGPYAAVSYSKAEHKTIAAGQDFDITGIESVFGYGFENGIFADIGYVWQEYKPDNATDTNPKIKTSGIEATVAWNLNSNFTVDVETYFSLSSDAKKKHNVATSSYYVSPYSKNEKAIAVNAIYFL